MEDQKSFVEEYQASNIFHISFQQKMLTHDEYMAEFERQTQTNWKQLFWRQKTK